MTSSKNPTSFMGGSVKQMLKGINVNGMTRYSYDCPYCDYCLWIYVQPLTGKLIKIEKAEKEINSETSHNSGIIQDIQNKHKFIKKKGIFKRSKLKSLFG